MSKQKGTVPFRPRKRSSQGQGERIDFVRGVQKRAGLTQEELARMIGVPLETLKKLFQGKRTITQEHLNLILLETGVDFSATVPKKGSSLQNKNWEVIKATSSANAQEFITESVGRLASVLVSAITEDKLLVALYLFEKSIEKLIRDLDLEPNPEQFPENFSTTRINDLIKRCLSTKNA